MAFLYFELIFFLFAYGSLKEKANLLIVHFDNLLDDLIREVVNGNFFVVFPYHDVLLFKVNADKLVFTVEE